MKKIIFKESKKMVKEMTDDLEVKIIESKSPYHQIQGNKMYYVDEYGNKSLNMSCSKEIEIE